MTCDLEDPAKDGKVAFLELVRLFLLIAPCSLLHFLHLHFSLLLLAIGFLLLAIELGFDLSLVDRIKEEKG